MLAPAGLLVLMLLGGLAVDSAIALGAQRELENRIVGAVNDATVLSLTPDELQRGPNAEMSPALVQRVVVERVASAAGNRLVVAPQDVVVETDLSTASVTVTAQGSAPYIFAEAIPGRGDRATVRSQVTAQLNYRGAQ